MGFDAEATKAYLTELKRLLYDAQRARERLNDTPILPAGSPALASAARALVSAAAGISRLLWPDPGRRAGSELAKQRGEHLRRLLRLDDDHPLVSRQLRNHLEHFDERLDRVVAARTGRKVFASVIASSEDLTSQFGMEKESMVFLLDKGADAVIVCGERFSLAELSEGCEDVARRLASIGPAADEAL